MSSSVVSLLAPLDRFYAAAGVVPPTVEAVTGDDVPLALRLLLTGPGPLTSRLEHRHGEPLALRVLERRRRGDLYSRRVVLVRGGDGVPVSLGAIEVDLTRLPPALRADVLAEKVPFGYVVAAAAVGPDALLRVARDALIGRALELTTSAEWLYGRRRTLVDGRGATVATIVEILAPDCAPSSAQHSGSSGR